MNINYTYQNDTFSFFFINENQNIIAIAEWPKLQAEFLSQLAILNELHDNGLAEYSNESCVIESLAIINLTEIDRQILELPSFFPFEILIEPEGILTHKSFKFKYNFYDFAPNGKRLNATRDGSLLTIENNKYLLSKNQYLICNAIDEFNNLTENEKGDIKNLKTLSEIKALSKDSGLTLEHFLNNQDLYIPNKIKLDIDFKEDLLEIIPTLEIENTVGFTNLFDKLPIIRDIYPITNGNGETTRVIFSENQKKELLKIKKQRKISDKHSIQEIIEHPELYFNGEEIDYTVFYSDRVKEIGMYSPKFYPFASPYKSQWIPGIIIDDKIDGQKKIHFKSIEKLYEFIEQKEKAQKQNKQALNWENASIPLESAAKFIKIAKAQFEQPNEPIKRDKHNNIEVLIIKENAEFTEFTNGSELPVNLQHNFYEIPNLSRGIGLKDHQKEGISWLQSLLKESFTGGLLADDMGLGKTLQLLYFIEWHAQTFFDNKPYLIVAPVSLLENWENEYLKFFNPQNLPLYKLYGNISLTKENDPIKNRHDAKGMQFKQIILTNYETIRNYQISLGLIDFAIIALDEAQKIKTPGTIVTNACKALKADFRIAMTGTPIENTLMDIWCLMDFAVPGLLGNAKDFASEYQRPSAILDNTEIIKLTENLRNNIGIFLKRRLKIDVAKDLTKKHDGENSRIKKVMPSIQLDRYLQEIQIANDVSSQNTVGRNNKLKLLWSIRDISDHPYLLDSQILKFTSEELIQSSSKLQTTIGILANIKPQNEKVIIFAERKQTQKMLQKVIYDIFELFPSIINGDTPSIKQNENKSNISRQQTIDRYQSEQGFNVIIMSPLSAGIGLNVTQANHIIHYTRHWNPAKEEQATDRAYRIGQQKDVFVYYPMAVFPDNIKDENGESLKSFDEILDTLLANKKNLARNSLFPTEQAEITPDEIFSDIFTTKTDFKSTYLTLKAIDRLHPNLFEASIATIYMKQGFEIHLTPYSNDKGADIVLLKPGENYLVQAKQTKSLVGNNAIQEVYTAKKYYEQRYKVQFQLLVITNNNYSSSAMNLAKINEVTLVNRFQLEEMINNTQIKILEVNKIESQRLAKI